MKKKKRECDWGVGGAEYKNDFRIVSEIVMDEVEGVFSGYFSRYVLMFENVKIDNGEFT